VKNKFLFISLLAALFLMAAALAYFMQPAESPALSAPAGEKLEDVPIAAEEFIPPGVPKSVAGAFATQFTALRAATRAQTLPDLPFKDIHGKTWRMEDFQGRPTLVNYWATWCAPCVVELPSLQKLADHYEGRLNVVAIALDPTADAAKIADFLKNRMLGDFAGFLDEEGALMAPLGLRGLPTSFLLGSDGLILYRFEGDADWASAHSRAFFDVFLMQNR